MRMALSLAGPVKADAVEETDKPWIVANRIKEWKHFRRPQEIRLPPVALLQPDKRLVFVAQAKVSEYESGCRNVAGLFTSFQLFEQPKCVAATANLSISVSQKANKSRAAVGDGNSNPRQLAVHC